MIKLKLSLMMLLQYMMFAVWWVPLAAYLTNLDVSSFQKSMILSSLAIGCMFSPLAGAIADRLWAGEKVLAAMNLIHGFMLLWAATAENPNVLFIGLLIGMLAYMPSWGLTSSIAMAHIPSEDFPKIRVFGSVGWVVSGIFSLIFIRILNIGFDGTHIPFYCGAAVSFIAAASNLWLPHTPPQGKGKKFSAMDSFGLGTLKLMADKKFAAFIVVSFISVIPFAMYYSYFSEFLLDNNARYISITINWGILAEMGFMLLVPLAVKKVGLRNTMILGLLALVIRYLAFYTGGIINQPALYFVGILIHGLIFGFFYVGGQIYIDKTAPAELRSQAQGFIFLVTFGLGLLAGNIISGAIIQQFKNNDGYNWDIIWGITTLFSVAVLLLFTIFFTGSKKTAETSQNYV